MPDLAVVIAAYEAERTVGSAVRSAFAAGAAEVIVVDDGSSDATGAVAAAVGATVIRQTNAGAAAARRVGFASAVSDLIVFLDADDELVAEGVQRSIQIHIDSTEPVTVGGRTVAVEPGGGERFLSSWSSPLTVSDLIERGTSPGPPSMFVWRRSILARVLADAPEGMWPRYAEDYELNIRGAMLAPVLLHSDVSVRYAAVGGKSAVNPLKSLKCADEIRSYYAGIAGMRVRSLSTRQLRARGWMRHSWVAATERRIARRLAYATLSAISDPSYVWSLLIKKASN